MCASGGTGDGAAEGRWGANAAESDGSSGRSAFLSLPLCVYLSDERACVNRRPNAMHGRSGRLSLSLSTIRTDMNHHLHHHYQRTNGAAEQRRRDSSGFRFEC